MAGDFDWVDRKNSLHLLLAYNGLLVSPCTSSAIGSCDDLPIPTLFSFFLLSSVLNMTLNCINYALMLHNYDRYVERSLSQDTLA